MTGDVGALGWWDLFINYGYDLSLCHSSLFVEMSDSLIRDLAHPGLRSVLHFLFVQDGLIP